MTDKYCPRNEMKKARGLNEEFESEISDNVEMYVPVGLPDMIHESIVASKPKDHAKAVETATEQMERKSAPGLVKRSHTGDPNPYAQNEIITMMGPCAPKCQKCNKLGHFARDCRSAGNANNANNQRGTGSGQKPTCFECGVQGHFKRECPKLKNNKNRGN
ncbi:putative reverse transcriptase domain-containing protein [Tanacetum coccineum]